MFPLHQIPKSMVKWFFKKKLVHKKGKKQRGDNSNNIWEVEKQIVERQLTQEAWKNWISSQEQGKMEDSPNYTTGSQNT